MPRSGLSSRPAVPSSRRGAYGPTPAAAHPHREPRHLLPSSRASAPKGPLGIATLTGRPPEGDAQAFGAPAEPLQELRAPLGPVIARVVDEARRWKGCAAAVGRAGVATWSTTISAPTGGAPDPPAPIRVPPHRQAVAAPDGTNPPTAHHDRVGARLMTSRVSERRRHGVRTGPRRLHPRSRWPPARRPRRSQPARRPPRRGLLRRPGRERRRRRCEARREVVSAGREEP